MLDLETLGQKPGSVIVAIGAVKFNEREIFSEFYARVNPESCVASGLQLDISTVMWWLKQESAARLEITKPGKPLSEVLGSFSEWLTANDVDVCVWGNGVGFDNALLRAAYEAIQTPCPWGFRNDRCYRTLKELVDDVPIMRAGTHHNALDDAKSQALHLMQILGRIN